MAYAPRRKGDTIEGMPGPFLVKLLRDKRLLTIKNPKTSTMSWQLIDGQKLSGWTKFKRLGMKKGNLQIANVEAIEQWIKDGEDGDNGSESERTGIMQAAVRNNSHRPPLAVPESNWKNWTGTP